MSLVSFFFFNDTATTEIYTLSLHDALPIYACVIRQAAYAAPKPLSMFTTVTPAAQLFSMARSAVRPRSEEHTSELQSRQYLVCRLLLEKKKRSHPEIGSAHA